MIKNDYLGYLTIDEYISLLDDFYNKYHPNKKVYNLYIHFPFCRSLCKYCVYGKYKIEYYKGMIKKYENTMLKALYKINEFVNKYNIVFESIYFGGGTASLWSFNFLNNARQLDMFDKCEFIEYELHPLDIDSKLNYLINVFKVNRISIGIQSFNVNSNKHQNRFQPDIGILSNAISEINKKNIISNIDLIGFYNGDTINDLEISKDDIYKAMDLNPNSIMITPNYQSDSFFNDAKKLRLLFNEINNNNSSYSTNSGLLSLDDKDVISHGSKYYSFINNDIIKYYDTSVDKIESIHLKPFDLLEYDSYYEKNKLLNVIGIGGLDKSTGISKTSIPEIFSIDCMFIQSDNEFIFKIKDYKTDFEVLSSDDLLFSKGFLAGDKYIKIPNQIL